MTRRIAARTLVVVSALACLAIVDVGAIAGRPVRLVYNFTRFTENPDAIAPKGWDAISPSGGKVDGKLQVFLIFCLRLRVAPEILAAPNTDSVPTFAFRPPDPE